MDLSKLPKLSDTAEQRRREGESAGEPVPVERAPLEYRPVPPQGYIAQPGGPEAWISAAMGVLLLLLNPRLIQYLLSPGTIDQKWKFSDAQGQPLSYTRTVFFWSDVAITLFCVVLIFDAIVLLKCRSRAIILAALGLTVLATLANLAYLLATFNTYGLPIMSAIAVAYGGYIAIHQWRLLTLAR